MKQINFLALSFNMNTQILYYGVPILLVVVYVYTIITILKSPLSQKMKLLWILVCLCLPFLGTILYYLMGKTTD